MLGLCSVHPVCPCDPLSPSLAELCYRLRDSVTPPIHSEFRVACVLVYRNLRTNALHYVTGCNIEAANISLCICAERCALGKLREVPDPIEIASLHLTSDSSSPLTPGPLCRELLAEHAPLTTPIIALPANAADPPNSYTLAELYPYPCRYRAVGRSSVQAHAEAIAHTITPPTNPLHATAIDAAVTAAKGMRGGVVEVYPVHYAAAAMFPSGAVRVATQLKALEFPASTDAVTALIALIRGESDELPFDERSMSLEVEKSCYVRVYSENQIVQADQYGVVHAPFAHARSWLHEHGAEWSGVEVLVPQEAGKGWCVVGVSTDTLLPSFDHVGTDHCLCT